MDQSFEDVLQPLIDTQSPENKFDLVGCCSRFRACSDAQKCLIPNSDISACCAYRKNLEAGKIFYGKNSGGFSIEEYESFLTKISKLPSEQLTTFKNIIGYLCNLHSSGILLYANSSIMHPALNQLLSMNHADQYVLNQYRIQSISKILKKFPDKNSAYGKAEKEAKIRKDSASFDKKSFLLQWCIANAPEITEQITKRYVMVSIPAANRQYIYEYYYEHILPENFQFELELPMETDANFLKKSSPSMP